MTDVAAELKHGNRAIDDAATEAGRDLRDIRRLFDFAGTFGPRAEAWSTGRRNSGRRRCCPSCRAWVSVLILVGEDPRTIPRWGVEAGPALREAVARERVNPA